MKKFLDWHAGDDLSPEFTRAVIFTQFITIALICAVVAVTVVSGGNSLTVWLLSVTLVIILVSVALAYRGMSGPSRMLVPLSFVFVVTINAINGNGLHDITMFGLPIALLVGSMIAGRRSIWIATLFCLLSIVAVGYSDIYGVTDSPFASATSLDDIIITSILIVSLAVVLNFLMGRMEEGIREARRNAMAYRDAESRFRAFMETSPAIVIMKDENGRYVYCNSKVELLFGMQADQIVGKTEFDLFPAEDAEKFTESDRKVLTTGEPFMHEYPAHDPSGNLHEWWVFKFLLSDSRGNKYVGMQILDITQRKQAEIALRHERDLLQALMQSVQDTVYFKDLQSRFTRINDKQTQILGVESVDDALGKTDFDFQPRELAQVFYDEEQKLFRTGIPIVDRVEYNPTRDGKPRWFSASKFPLLDADHIITGLVGISRDITERKLAEIERERLFKDLERRNAELEQFTYTVSHDLRSPLVTIDGFLGYIEKNATSGHFEKISADIKRVKDATGRMQGLLKDLLELSRIGRMMNEPEDVPFSQVVRDALGIMDGAIKNRGVDVKVFETTAVIHVDRTRLVQVMQNLIENACKYMGGQKEPRIEIGQREEGEPDTATFYVCDNGMGIDPQHQDKIFGLFNKLDASSEGTGIGLALARRIIEVHHGRIWVESKGVGMGSTFCFTLPVKQ